MKELLKSYLILKQNLIQVLSIFKLLKNQILSYATILYMQATEITWQSTTEKKAL